jgi:predicted DNA binding CopG/RHH family protein
MSKIIPAFQSDKDAEQFVDDADLSRYDLGGFAPTSFEFEPKASQLNMRLPASLLEAVKARAKDRGIPYTRFVRETLEQAVAGREP